MSQPIPQEVEEKIKLFYQKCEYERGEQSTHYTHRCANFLRQALLSVYNSGREDKRVVERVAKAIYDQMSYYEDGAKPAWVEGGNSLKQDEARRLAIAALSAPSSEDKV